jgi:hypothetical protein
MKTLFLLLIVTLSVSCSKPDEGQQVFAPITIIPIQIVKQSLNGNEGISQQSIVIQDNTNWNNLKNQIDSWYISHGLGNYLTNIQFSETNIDFNNFQVIAVFDQIFGNGGHTIDITNVVENDNNITITVDRLLRGNATPTVTQPYHIIKILKSTKPVVFQ